MKDRILIVEQNMNFSDVFNAELKKIYPSDIFFESWDVPFQYTFIRKLRNLVHRNYLENKNYLENLKQEQYDLFCKKCIDRFEKEHPYRYKMGLVFRADRLPHLLLQYLTQKVDKLVAFQYDGLHSTPLFMGKKKYFAKSFVFDPADVSVQDNIFFATNIHYNLPKNRENQYDIIYLGSNTDDRLQNIENILRETSGLKKWITLCGQNNEERKGDDIQFLNKHVPYSEYLKIAATSKAIVDIKTAIHNGLSFRFFEGLNFERKVITNNAAVTRYDFYHPDNIFVTDFENFNGLQEFLNKPYHEIDERIVQQYSLQNWIKYVFDMPDHLLIPLPQLQD